MLGRCSEQGFGGMLKSNKEAMKYYKLAAEGGDLEAMYYLGDYYLNAKNADYDVDEGFNYIEDAARANYTPAILRLADCYLNGIGIEKDPDYAKDLATKAKNLGNPDAQDFLNKNFDYSL